MERAVAAPHRGADNPRAESAARRVTTDLFTTPTTTNQTDVEEVQVCWLCGGTPCDWLEYSNELLQEIEEKYLKNSNGNRIDGATHEVVGMKKIRYALYRSFAYARYGWLGKNNRIKLGRSLQEKIKELFPHPEGVEYTGFLPADEDVLE